MPPENTPTEESTEETPASEETPSEETPAGETPSEETSNEEESEESSEDEGKQLSHEDALKALTKTRSEAASWRTKYREVEKKLADAKTPEEFEKVRADLTAEAHDLLVENVALHHSLPNELAAVLKDASAGKSREEIEAHAKALAKFVPAEEPEPEGSGGLNPGGDSDEGFDPVAEARAARRRRY